MDLIDRQVAIDAFLTELTRRERKNLLHTWSTVEVKYFVVDMLEKLPSVQQDCTECEDYDSETKSCPKYCDVIRRTLEEAKQERTGRWIHDGYAFKGGIDWMHCSECGHKDCWSAATRTPFCAWCGAKMEGES